MINPLSIYRRHNPKHCTSTDSQKCSSKRKPCPIWIYGTLPDGRQIRESMGTRDWAKAEELKKDWEENGAEPKPPAGRTTIAEWREKFLKSIEKENLASETQRKYRLIFRQLEAFAQDKGLRFVNEFDLDMLMQFRNTWTDQPLSATKKIEQLRSVFRFAFKLKWIEENPAADLKKPKIEEDTTGDPFTEDEMTRIIKAAKEDSPAVLAFVLLMRYSGLRISDAATLRVDSLQGRYVSVKMRKTGGLVKVQLPEFVADMLRGLSHSNPDHFFWTGSSKVTTVTNLWRHKKLARVFKRAGVEGYPHQFRHTFAVRLLEAGTPIEIVSNQLGHKNIRITQKHYEKWTNQRQKAADEAVEAANGFHEYERLVRSQEADVVPIRRKA